MKKYSRLPKGGREFLYSKMKAEHEKKHHPQGSQVLKNGTYSARSGARTLDTLIKSQVLYQLS